MKIPAAFLPWRWRAMREARERALDAEIRLHLDLDAEESLAPANATLIKEQTRDAWAWTAVERLVQDVRFALRAMRKGPAYAAVAVLTLALGIGANTAIFSIVRAVLLRPLAYENPGRLVTVLLHGSDPVAPGHFLDWQRQARSFEQMASASAYSPTLTGRDHAEQIIGLQVSDGMFRLLGVQPLHGRTFAPEESQPGRDSVVVLGYGLWQRRFGGSLDILGQTINLNGRPHTVVGVMPRTFAFSPFWITGAELWAPLPLADQATNRAAQYLRVFARLRPGVEIAQAQTEIDTLSKRFEQAYPATDTALDARVDPLREKVVGKVRPALLVLLGAVGFVLLIACANLANLALARTAERSKEIAIRLALGAGGRRVFRQLLTESLVLAIVGGAFGLLLAVWGVDALKAVIHTGGERLRSPLPRLDEATLDVPVLCCALLLSTFTGLLFGVLPALQATRAAMAGALKEGGRASSEGTRGARMRGLLVVAQVAICLVLLAGAGLLARTFLELRRIDPGFDPAHVLTMTVSLAAQPEYVGARRNAFYDRVVRDVVALPGVVSVSMVNHLPLAGDVWGTSVFAEGESLPARGREIHTVFRACRPGYFGTMGIPLIAGRDFNPHDTQSAPAVVIVNEKLARRLWPSADPIGKRLTLDDPRRPSPAWAIVAGVIKNIKQDDWSAQPDHEVYLPYEQSKEFVAGTHSATSYMTLVVRAAGDPLAAAPMIESAIWSIDKNVALSQVQSLDEVIAASLWQSRFHMLIIGLFAAFALLLAVVGIYGVMAYSVTRRTHEIGIRMALGARSGAVRWMVVRQGALLALTGIALGLAGAFALTRSLSSMLYGVSAADPLTFTLVPAALAAVALLAAYLPARRASRIDPIRALRME